MGKTGIAVPHHCIPLPVRLVSSCVAIPCSILRPTMPSALGIHGNSIGFQLTNSKRNSSILPNLHVATVALQRAGVRRLPSSDWQSLIARSPPEMAKSSPLGADSQTQSRFSNPMDPKMHLPWGLMQDHSPPKQSMIALCFPIHVCNHPLSGRSYVKGRRQETRPRP
ncbi:hypothetical protein LY78DRAFT_481949 [Colletotrichum sublineola]|nr:hypothetical protein LY78DRAFT_481949 [Colletotrichum sublineola]